jgi:hypothetical protein
MIKHSISSMLRRLALAVALAAGSSAAQAGIIHVSVDTSKFSAASGYLDMQLSADPGASLATAVVSNMVGFGALDWNFGVKALPGGFGFRNDVSNYLSHAVTFGGLVSFDLTFDGEYDPLTAYESHFTVTAFDELFAFQGDFDPLTGVLADFKWTPSVTASGEGGLSFAVAEANVTVVPEPAGLLLSGGGIAALAMARRRRNVRAGQVG